MHKNGYRAIVEVSGRFVEISLDETLVKNNFPSISDKVLFVHETDTQSISNVYELIV